MSFCDKVSNGIAVIVIQRMAPDTICKCNMSVTFYKIVMVYVPGVAAVVGICGILALWFAKPRQVGGVVRGGDGFARDQHSYHVDCEFGGAIR